MDKREIEEAVERKRERMKHHGYAIEQDRIDDETLLSLAQLFLEAGKGMPQPTCDICKGNGWTSEHDQSFGSHDKTTGECLGTCPIQEPCRFCQGTGIEENKKKVFDLCTAHLVKKCEGIEEILKEAHFNGSHYRECDFDSKDLAQAIKDYLLKEEVS